MYLNITGYHEDVPAGTTHLLVYTWNRDGERPDPRATPLHDRGVPTHYPTDLAFTDEDLDFMEVSGTVTFREPADASDITQYNLYLVCAGAPLERGEGLRWLFVK